MPGPPQRALPAQGPREHQPQSPHCFRTIVRNFIGPQWQQASQIAAAVIMSPALRNHPVERLICLLKQT